MENLLTHVSEIYGIEELSISSKIDIGYTSTNYILSTGSTKYFLKQFDSQFDVEKVEWIVSMMQNFVTEKIPSVTPLKSLEDKLFFEFENRIYSLFPFIDGEVKENNQLTAEDLVAIGALHGELLKVGEKVSVSSNKIESLQKKYDVFVAENSQIRGQLSRFDKPTQNKIIEIQSQKERFYTNITADQLTLDTRVGLTHGDYWQRNIMFEDNEIVGLIDFDKVDTDYLIKEVMRAIDVICFSNDYSAREYAMVKSYLKGLLQKFTISQEEFEKGLEYWRTSQMLNNVIVKNLVLRDNDKFLELLDINLLRVSIWGDGYEKHKQLLLKSFDNYLL